MKTIKLAVMLVLLSVANIYAVNPNFVPYAAGVGALGITTNRWPAVWSWDLTNTYGINTATFTASGLSALTTLTVSGTSALNGNNTLGDASGDTLTINGNSAYIVNDLILSTAAVAPVANKIILQSSNGRIGIGMTNPTVPLDIAGAAQLTGNFTLSGTAANILLGSNYLSGDGGDEGISVDATGNIAIEGGSAGDSGTTALGSLVLRDAGATSLELNIGISNNDSATYIQGRQTGTTTKFPLLLNPNGGNVGVSTGVPAGIFQVGNGTFTVKVSGNVGIGTTNPAQKLHISAGTVAVSSATTSTEYAQWGGVRNGVAEAGVQSAGFTFVNKGDNYKIYTSTCTTPADGAYCYEKVGAQ